ncbi:MAG TPA: methyltransferase domain-containing protein [Nitrospira sp.]|nr:methyltransferase domain-containing protein [Nitrospira sp.]
MPDTSFSEPRNEPSSHGRSSIRSQLISALAWPMKTLVRRLMGDECYQQAQVTLLHELGGVGLDWRWGNSLRRVHPIRRDFAWQSGRPIDRSYTEDCFLLAHRADIRGRALEIGDDRYTRKFGGERVIISDILHVNPGMGGSTIQADLTDAKHIPSNRYDCAILTFTLQFIFDVPAALATLERILCPGGVLLVIVPGISQITRYDMDNWGEFWRFTSLSARRLFEQVFQAEDITVTTYGNVLASLASLHGLHSTELTTAELDHWDRDYELVIGIRAVKRPDHRTVA